MNRLPSRDWLAGAVLVIVGSFFLAGRLVPGLERFIPLFVGLALVGVFLLIRTHGALVPGGILCGVEWFTRTFEELDPDVEIFWHHADGDEIVAKTSLCEIEGRARAMLTAERTAMNFVWFECSAYSAWI